MKMLTAHILISFKNLYCDKKNYIICEWLNYQVRKWDSVNPFYVAIYLLSGFSFNVCKTELVWYQSIVLEHNYFRWI